jgi:polyhydroxybutyrate depolymerase
MLLRSPSALLAATFLFGGLAAQAVELPGVRAATDEACARLGLAAGLVVARADTLLHRTDHGGFTGSTVLPIASASKWLAVATVLTLVDEGKLDLDVPVGRYVAEFDRADKRALTLRTCLACTGGVPARLPRMGRGMDMAKFAAAAADSALRGQPGAGFQYGGVGFQIAAVAAERVTGQRWHELFAERIAAKVRMPDTRFGTLTPVGGEPGTAALPWVAGGAVSTLDDYTRFLRMLLGKGEIDGVRVLGETSTAAMFRDQVSAHVEVHSVGFEADQVRYGLGTWITTPEGGVVRVSDPGAFGFTPWIDTDLGIGGVFAVRDRVGRVLPELARIQGAVRAAMQSPQIAGEAETVTLEHGGRDRRYHLHVPPHAQNIVGLPLLLVLHGGGGNGEQVRASTGLAEAGLRAGYVVVFPDGTGPVRGKLLTWNSGGITVYASEHDVDDVGFLRAVVGDVQKRVAIDPARVFAAGHSNGGMMCHRLAREAADLFTGIAVVSGAMNFTAVDAKSPIAVLLVHGSADQHVLYDGGTPRAAIGRVGDRRDASVRMAIDYYIERNGLNGYPDKKVDGKVCTDTWALGKGGKATLPVQVITLEGGGHAWPGAAETPSRRSDTPFPFDASAAILKFCSDVAANRPAAEPGGR